MLEVGKTYTVTVFEDEETLVGMVIERTDQAQVEVSLFSNEGDELVTASFVLWMAAEQIAHSLNLSDAKALAQQAIDRIKEGYAARGEESPSPTDVNDIPF